MARPHKRKSEVITMGLPKLMTISQGEPVPSLISAYSPEAVAVSLPAWLDFAAVIVGSLSGAIAARERHLDAVGFVGLALLCGLGGGLLRDCMMQVGDVYMLSSPYAIPVSALTGIVLFLFPQTISSTDRLLEWVDILAVALFSLMGTDKAIVWSLLPFPSILMGVITGVGGGMLRDVFLGEVPRIFQPSNFYALCALAGSTTYYIAVMIFSINKPWAAVLCMVVTVALRRWSLHYNVKTPADVNLAMKISQRYK